MSLYQGWRTEQAGGAQVWRDGLPLLAGHSQRLYNHSPNGFEWGYGGSGPAQLALALLLCETTEPEALYRYQDFKRSIVAGLPSGVPGQWQLRSDDIQEWLAMARAVDPMEPETGGTNGES